MRNHVFSQLYVSAALVAFASSFAPLWVPAAAASPHTDIGTFSLWTVIPTDGGGVSFIGAMMLVTMTGIAVAAAAVRDVGVWAPLWLLALSVAGVLMLPAKPDTPSPTPSFGPGAGLIFGASLALAATAVADLLSRLVGAQTAVEEAETRLSSP